MNNDKKYEIDKLAKSDDFNIFQDVVEVIKQQEGIEVISKPELKKLLDEYLNQEVR